MGSGGGGNPRRDPSEKQEPHTVMWGKIYPDETLIDPKPIPKKP